MRRKILSSEQDFDDISFYFWTLYDFRVSYGLRQGHIKKGTAREEAEFFRARLRLGIILSWLHTAQAKILNGCIVENHYTSQVFKIFKESTS